MQKIPSLFVRDPKTRTIRNEITPGCEWVVQGLGAATPKYDGTACMVRDGKLYKRYDAKHGKVRPPDFEPAQDPDPITGHWPGWVPVSTEKSSDQYHCEAVKGNVEQTGLGDGTYELVGPKVQDNPYGLKKHDLWRHGKGAWPKTSEPPRTFDRLREWFQEAPGAVEGIVWYYEVQGKLLMVKVKRTDFGLPWPPRSLRPRRSINKDVRMKISRGK